MRPNKEGQHLSSPFFWERVSYLHFGLFSLIPRRQSRRNQVSDFENEVNRNSVKGENKEWWWDCFWSNPLATETWWRKQVRHLEELVAEQSCRGRLSTKRERWPNAEQEMNWEKVDNSWCKKKGKWNVQYLPPHTPQGQNLMWRIWDVEGSSQGKKHLKNSTKTENE